MIQGSDAWRMARCGSLGASSLHEALAKTKAGWGASRENVMARLIVERLTGKPQDGFTNSAMQYGTEMEPEARDAYEFYQDCEVEQVALVRHPMIQWTHASPDGLVGHDGLLEIKCPNSATHLATLESGSIPHRYQLQMLWQMACTDRSWCDFVSYDARMPPKMRLFIKRFHADAARIAELEKQVVAFLAETDTRHRALEAKYFDMREAA